MPAITFGSWAAGALVCSRVRRIIPAICTGKPETAKRTSAAAGIVLRANTTVISTYTNNAPSMYKKLFFCSRLTKPTTSTPPRIVPEKKEAFINPHQLASLCST
ncbi:hypothetical protein D3C73_1097230 [compost metagenome]